MILIKDFSSHEYFRVIAKDTENTHYFVARLKNFTDSQGEFCWCIANECLEVGEITKGHLQPSLEKLPC